MAVRLLVPVFVNYRMERMNEINYPRSPLLLSPASSTLLVVDVQEKLLPLIEHPQSIERNILLLLQSAQLLGVKSALTEQYPRGLGPTIESIRNFDGPIAHEKTMFSCRQSAAIFDEAHHSGRRQFVVVGIETHVCVQQTVLDVLGMGFDVFVIADAVGSRHGLDHDLALKRMEISGACITTVESAVFEWCESSQHPNFKQISQWIKQRDSENRIA